MTSSILKNLTKILGKRTRQDAVDVDVDYDASLALPPRKARH